MPKRYRSRPVVVEAMQWSGQVVDATAIIGWIQANGGTARYQEASPGGVAPTCLNIDTLEGVMKASPGDFIIRGTAGEFYPCKPDIFAVKYEEQGP